jgi:hypothetical protein
MPTRSDYKPETICHQTNKARRNNENLCIGHSIFNSHLLYFDTKGEDAKRAGDAAMGITTSLLKTRRMPIRHSAATLTGGMTNLNKCNADLEMEWVKTRRMKMTM